VYAIEANAVAAELARRTVKTSGYADVITVLEGLSTDIILPEKVDVVIAEIIGSVSTEEGVLASIRDAHSRHVKHPGAESSWIPHRIQTLAAPSSYTLHNLFRPPDFDWCKLQGEPVRFNCRDEGLQLLSAPQLLEDVSFPTINSMIDTDTERRQLNFVLLCPTNYELLQIAANRCLIDCSRDATLSFRSKLSMRLAKLSSSAVASSTICPINGCGRPDTPRADST
jgi:hypothetical protein